MAEEVFYAGIDVGTSYIKVVIINRKNEIKGYYVERLSSDLQKSINIAFKKALDMANISKSLINHITSTGFGRENISFKDGVKTEISCHAKGAFNYFPKKITVIDIGGQDTKIIKTDKEGKIIGFKMNRKCAAGTGSFLEEIAFKLNIPLNKINAIALKSNKDTSLGSYCTVFASTEILTRIKEGEKVEDMIKSAFESVVKRVIEMDTLEGNIVLTGGVIEYNNLILKILEKRAKVKIHTPPNPQLIGAYGAALFAKEAKD